MDRGWTPTLVLASIAVAVILSYLVAWRSKRKAAQKRVSIAVAGVAGIAALIAFSVAVRGLYDFRAPGNRWWEKLLVEGVMFGIAIGLALFGLKSIGSER